MMVANLGLTNCDGNHCLNQDIVYEAPNHCSAQPQLGKRICINYKKYHWKISFMNDCFHFYMDIPKH